MSTFSPSPLPQPIHNPELHIINGINYGKTTCEDSLAGTGLGWCCCNEGIFAFKWLLMRWWWYDPPTLPHENWTYELGQLGRLMIKIHRREKQIVVCLFVVVTIDMLLLLLLPFCLQFAKYILAVVLLLLVLSALCLCLSSLCPLDWQFMTPARPHPHVMASLGMRMPMIGGADIMCALNWGI